MVEHREHDPKRVESLRMQIDSLIQNYLNQKPTPGIADFAEAFGAEAYVTEMKRQKAVTVNIKAFREEIVERLLTQVEVTGIDVVLPKVFEMLPQTILPPDEGEIKTGSGEGIEKKRFIPRTQYLIELLSEIGEQYEIIGGKNTSDMMRERTYFIFFLPDSQKAIFVNNEEGNTTFIVYQVESKQQAIDLAALTKDEVRAKELHSHPYAQIDWTGDEESWKGKLLDFLKLERPPEKIVSVSTEDENILQTSNVDSKRNRTLESAVNELEGAYRLWKAEDQKVRGEFNTTWLRKKGFEGLYQWTRKKKIGLKTLVSHASLELQEDFDKIERHTPESALLELEQAYGEWKAQDEKNRGKFNSLWLQENEHYGLYAWAYRNGGIDSLVLKASKELQDDFERLERQVYTKEVALDLLEKAHQKWKSQDEKTRNKFNLQWLKSNDFDPLIQWIYRHGGVDVYIRASSKELQNDYQKREEKDFPSFDDLKKDVKEKGIKTVTEYQEKYKLYKWPSSPSNIYKDQWISWPSFLGKK